MATETLKTAWLDDENGAKFAPKTLIESIQDAEGTSLDDRLASAGMSAEVEGTRLKLGAGGGTSSGIHKYSTEEQVIGTWIDGITPIYEKTVKLEKDVTVNNDNWSELFSIPGIKRINSCMLSYTPDTDKENIYYILRYKLDGEKVTAANHRIGYIWTGAYFTIQYMKN